ncbi:MAG: phosphate starvation-inducible protein PhoH [Acidobacteria bacterium 21-70-11]|nr:MAG: phosphate starvation-inducible protein PhoH [Acidobacteria bacterium 21-70-11]OYW06143.1 MAG: phosphate starvation-inducible protein PhoH [Acidobacteria bacterium 37-71-11]HQT94469.1 PhoH family protein [Thermoanaerobaculaceae bacterium]HQU33427.1 PhoH family protein [Thermoanaerobaculaceae bacterium]
MTTITLPERDLEILSGTLEENFKYLAERLRVRVAARGDTVSLEGDPEAVAAAGKLVAELGKLVASGYSVGKEEFRTALRVIEEDPEADLVQFFTDASIPDSVKRLVVPRNLKQRLFIQALIKFDIVFAVGPAGTGKTYLAVAMAAAALAEHRVKRIVLTRPAVEAGERLGFLPGDLVEKVNPYLRPVYDALYDILGYDRVARHIERGVIEIAPLAFMRGRTLNDSFMLLDEAQNTTPEQMKMFLTRLGFHSRAAITGDVTQIDLPNERGSGLVQARQILGNLPGICFFDFAKEDVVRHRLVEKVVAAYEAWDEAKRGNGS